MTSKPITKREIHFYIYGEPLRGLRFFELFAIAPAIITYSLNCTSISKRWMFERSVEIMILWWQIGISWRYGSKEKYGE